MKTLRLAAAALAAALMFGCTTGPDYKRPDVSMPGKWSEPLAGGEKSGEPDIAQWWKSFGDEKLDSLIARAAESNHDLRIAEARIREARASLNVAEAGLWPRLNASGSYSRVQMKAPETSATGANSLTRSPSGVTVTNTQTSPSGTTRTVSQNLSASGVSSSTTLTTSDAGRAPKRQTDLFQAGFDAGWELDVFGGARRAIEASTADAEATEESRRDVLITLAAEVALNYFDLRANQDVLDIVNKNIALQNESLELVRSRFQAGLTNELDVKNAEAQVATSQAAVPIFETAIKHSIHRLGVLLGSGPGSLQEELTPVASLPAAPPEVPVGLPSQLLRRRPDVRGAERALAAATARIGVATADLFPKFSLTGSLARQGDDLGGLKLGGNQLWSIGPGISWPVFDAGRIRANIRVQNARQEQALAAYEKAVMTSLEDVENALVAFAKEQTRLASLSAAVEANRHALDLANELYAKGLVNFLSVLDAERSLFASESQQTQSKAAILGNLVSLYKALGGGWDEKAADAQTPPAPETSAKSGN